MARIVVEGAKPCPFCGCGKMFLKLFITRLNYQKRHCASVQCSRCRVDGPRVYDDNKSFFFAPELDEEAVNRLRDKALDRWNERQGTF